MRFVKGIIIGVALGATVGMIIGANNSDCVYEMMRNGKRELKRFRRKYM